MAAAALSLSNRPTVHHYLFKWQSRRAASANFSLLIHQNNQIVLPSVGTATLSWTHSEFVDCFSVVRSRGLQTSIYHVKYWSASYWSVTFHHTWFGSRPGEESGRYCTYWWSFVLTHKLLFWNWSQSLVVFLCRGNFPLCRHVYLFKHFSVQAESTRVNRDVMQADCSRFRSPVWRLDPN